MQNKRKNNKKLVKRNNQLVPNRSPGKINIPKYPRLNNFIYNPKGDRVILGRSVRTVEVRNNRNEKLVIREEHDYINSNGKNNSKITNGNFYNE